ncbi:MAG: GntR family transcriptional regulator, partial [Desulfobacteraceae bacterium]
MDPISIYEDLRQKIIWLELKPGCTLNLVELAESYSVSRNPVMIAL